MQKSRRMAGPVLRSDDVALAAIEAIREDNPDRDVVVVDHGAYVRIEAEGGIILRRKTVEEYLGRTFSTKEIEVSLISFSGQIEIQEDFIRWYFLLQLPDLADGASRGSPDHSDMEGVGNKDER